MQSKLDLDGGEDVFVGRAVRSRTFSGIRLSTLIREMARPLILRRERFIMAILIPGFGQHLADEADHPGAVVVVQHQDVPFGHRLDVVVVDPTMR